MKAALSFVFVSCCALSGCTLADEEGVVAEESPESVLFATPVSDPVVTTTCLVPGEMNAVVLDAHAIGSVELERVLVDVVGSADSIVSADIWTPYQPGWSSSLVMGNSPDQTAFFLVGLNVGLVIDESSPVRIAVRVTLDASAEGEVSFSLHGMEYNGGVSTQSPPIPGSVITLSEQEPCP